MKIKKGYYYFAHHIPSGEDWFILGIDVKGNKVCAAGWPPTIGNLSDCKNIVPNREMDEHEIQYRQKQFGENWDN